jgi:hypothetical protein
MKNRTFVGALAMAASAVLLAGCSTDADVASANLSKDADQFRVERRIVFINGITDKYLLSIEGLCSIKSDNTDQQLEVTCKTGPDEYKKHFLGLSDNVTYLVEQIDGKSVDVYRYKVVFKPSVIVPDVELSTP